MTHTQTFIDSFIEGTDDLEYQFYDLNGILGVKKGEDFFDIHWLLLKPFVWQAVGKVWEWSGNTKYYMSQFIGYIADGKSIEDALDEILK